MRARVTGTSIGFVAVAVAGGALFAWLAEDAAGQRHYAWEHPVVRALVAVERGDFEGTMVAFSFLGAGIGLLILLTAAVLVLLRRRRYADIAFVCGSLLLAQVVNRVVKDLVEKRRPPVPDNDFAPVLNEVRLVVLLVLAGAFLVAMLTRRRGTALTAAAVLIGSFLLYEVIAPSVLTADNFSFPSGHATSSMAFAAAVVLVAWPSRARMPVVLAALVLVAGVGASRVSFGVHYPTDVLGGWSVAIATVCAVRGVLTALPEHAAVNMGAAPAPVPLREDPR